MACNLHPYHTDPTDYNYMIIHLDTLNPYTYQVLINYLTLYHIKIKETCFVMVRQIIGRIHFLIEITENIQKVLIFFEKMPLFSRIFSEGYWRSPNLLEKLQAGTLWPGNMFQSFFLEGIQRAMFAEWIIMM